jgi:hypothetical protein
MTMQLAHQCGVGAWSIPNAKRAGREALQCANRQLLLQQPNLPVTKPSHGTALHPTDHLPAGAAAAAAGAALAVFMVC